MNELQVYTHNEFGGIRGFLKNGQPWFVGKDVADILGYQNGSRDINRHVDKEDRLEYRFGTSGQNRRMTIINESGLYSLMLSSKLPKAKTFKRWVTSEVLPTIRQTGSYFKGNELDFVIQTVTTAIMKQLPAIVSETVKSVLHALPDTKANVQMNALDWNEISRWENLLSEWRDFRTNYSNKEQADNDFIVNCREKYPNAKIGRRTLYRKWREFTEKGSAGLLDKRGRHGNHKRKVVVTVEFADGGYYEVETEDKTENNGGL